MGCAHGREDRSPDRARTAPRVAGRLPRRLGRCAHHGSGRAVPRPAGSRTDLRQRGAPLGQGAAGLLPVRSFCRRRRVHPGVLRRGVHGRGQRFDVPRLTAHGRSRDRREGLARGDGRRADARHGQWMRRQPLRVRRRRDRFGPSFLVVPAYVLARVAGPDRRPGPGRQARARSARSCRRRSGAPTTCTR